MQLLSQGREEICENVESENLTLSIAPIVFGADFQSMDDNLKNFEIGKDEQNNIFCAESYVKKEDDGESDKRNDLRGDEMSDRTGDGDNDERLRSDDFVKGGDKCCMMRQFLCLIYLVTSVISAQEGTMSVGLNESNGMMRDGNFRVFKSESLEAIESNTKMFHFTF